MSWSNAAEEARAGSREAFVELIRGCEQRMYAIAKGLLKSESDTADAIQEAILKAYDGIGNLREPAHFHTWLIRILINECRRIARINGKFVPLSPDMEAADTSERSLFSGRLELFDLLRGLDQDHKEVVVLYYMEDIAVKDIAGMLGISEGTVKSRLYRARSRLAALIRTPEKEVDRQWNI